MHNENETFWLSASDLANHLGCRHLTQLDLAVAQGTLQPPTWRDPTAIILQERGLDPERTSLNHLRGQGWSISEPEPDKKSSGIQRTLVAMQEGVEIIYQAVLQKEHWHGRADFLKRVDHHCTLGSWSYEVQDAKLAREPEVAPFYSFASIPIWWLKFREFFLNRCTSLPPNQTFNLCLFASGFSGLLSIGSTKA